MVKRACLAVMWLALVAILASCGPTADTVATPEPGPMPSPADTPVPSSPPAVCQGRIAFVARDGGEEDISVVNADGTGLVNLTNGEGTETTPAWSPDGTRIVFARHAGNSDIYTIRPDGSDLVRLTDQTSRDYAPAWSPDGQSVLLGSQAGYASELFVVSAEGGEAVALTDSKAHKPDLAWSPDGSRIAFTMLDGYNQGDVFVMTAPGETGTAGRGVTNLTQHAAHDCCAAWAPDSSRLLFLSSRSDKEAGQASDSRVSSGVVRAFTTVVPKQPRDIYVIGGDGSGLTRLTDGQGYEKHASWSPDGKRIAFVSDRDGNDEVYVMTVSGGADAGGGDLIRLTNSPDDNTYPAWSPDGRCLAFVSYLDGNLGLWVVTVDGRGLSRLADSADWGSGPSWSP
jgi:Tol biopolymer transport system component